MTKKHYIRMAEMIRTGEFDTPMGAYITRGEMKSTIIAALCDFFAEDNVRFDRARFINACKTEGDK